MLQNNDWGLPKTLVLDDTKDYDVNLIGTLLHQKGLNLVSKKLITGIPYVVSKILLDNGYYFYSTKSLLTKELLRLPDQEVKRKLEYSVNKAELNDTLFLRDFRFFNPYAIKGISSSQFKKEVLAKDYPFVISDYSGRSWKGALAIETALLYLGYCKLRGGILKESYVFLKGKHI